MARPLLFLLPILLLSAPLAAQEGEATEELPFPKVRLLKVREDWSELQGRNREVAVAGLRQILERSSQVKDVVDGSLLHSATTLMAPQDMSIVYDDFDLQSLVGWLLDLGVAEEIKAPEPIELPSNNSLFGPNTPFMSRALPFERVALGKTTNLPAGELQEATRVLVGPRAPQEDAEQVGVELTTVHYRIVKYPVETILSENEQGTDRVRIALPPGEGVVWRVSINTTRTGGHIWLLVLRRSDSQDDSKALGQLPKAPKSLVEESRTRVSVRGGFGSRGGPAGSRAGGPPAVPGSPGSPAPAPGNPATPSARPGDTAPASVEAPTAGPTQVQIVHVANTTASEIAKSLGALLPGDGLRMTSGPNNSILLRGTPEAIEPALELIERLDVASEQKKLLQYGLRRPIADEAAAALRETLGEVAIEVEVDGPRVLRVVGKDEDVRRAVSIIQQIDGTPDGVTTTSMGTTVSNRSLPDSDETRQADAMAAKLAAELRGLPDSTPERAEAVKRLRDAVGESFRLRLGEQEREAAALRARLEAVESNLARRREHQAEIVERRVQTLLNPELDWPAEEASPAAPGTLR